MARACFSISGCENQPGGISAGFVGRKKDGSLYPTDSRQESFNFPTNGSARRAAKELAKIIAPQQVENLQVRIV